MERVIVRALDAPAECRKEGAVVLRLSGKSSDWTEVPWPSDSTPVSIEMPSGFLFLWALAVNPVSQHRGDEPHERLTTLGVGSVPLSFKTNVVLKDPSDNYAEICTLEVTMEPSGTRPLDLSILDDDLQRMEEIRLEHNRFWDESTLPPVVAAVRRMHLRRFTTTAGDLPAAAFARVGHDAPPPTALVVYRRVEAAAEMHGWETSDLMDVLRVFFKEPRLTPELVKAVEICADALTSVGAANDYIGDHTMGEKPAERFQISVSLFF